MDIAIELGMLWQLFVASHASFAIHLLTSFQNAYHALGTTFTYAMRGGVPVECR